MKKVILTVSESDCMTPDEVMAELKKAFGIEVFGRTPDGQSSYLIEFEGRRGKYDVVTDALEFDDDPENEHSFFDCDSDLYQGESLLETLDMTTFIWGEDENGDPIAYVEF